MKLLVLGGTVFVGRHVVESALARGHDVALFDRGKTHPALFPEAEKLRGDRDGDLAALKGRSFDAVIDASGYRPEHVRRSADALKGRISHYTFISSISAYRGFPPGRPYDENAPLAEGRESYGALKARSEETLGAEFPGALAVIRPGLIVGPHDPTGRFTYWPRRFAEGGEILAPGRPDRPVQFIDARDLAAWCVRLCEEKIAGRFNAVGPGSPLTMRRFLEACGRESNADARLHWVPDAVLVREGIQPWTELPLWLPEDDPDDGGACLGDNREAVAAGLTFRPIERTIKDTLEWSRLDETAMTPQPGRAAPLSRDKESRIRAALNPVHSS